MELNICCDAGCCDDDFENLLCRQHHRRRCGSDRHRHLQIPHRRRRRRHRHRRRLNRLRAARRPLATQFVVAKRQKLRATTTMLYDDFFLIHIFEFYIHINIGISIFLELIEIEIEAWQ
jgi:hypothetical protein